MRTPAATFLVILALAGGAVADDDCYVPMANWQPRDAVVRLAAEQGWTVRRIKIDDGCYEIDGTDPEGRRIEATVHPATLAVIELEYKGRPGTAHGPRRLQGEDDE